MMTEKVQSPSPDTEPREAVIRKFQAGDEKALNDLFNAVFRRNRSLEEWTWKFNGHPKGKGNFVTVAEVEGQIVGQYPNNVIPFKYFDTEQYFGQTVDNCIDPGYRGGMKGVQSRIFFFTVRWYEEENVWIGFGFPNHAAYVVGKRALKYRDIVTIPMLFRRLSLRPALRRRLPWLPSRVVEFVGRWSGLIYWLRLRKGPVGLVGGVTTRQIASFDERFDRLWKEAREGYTLSAVRDAAYLNWRYVAKPGERYVIFVAEQDQSLLGYIVGKMIEENGGRAGLLMDLLTVAHGPARVDDLLVRRLFRHFVTLRVDYALAWMLPHDRLYPALLRQAMREREEFPKAHMIYVITSPGKPDETVIRDVRNWHVTLGDADAY